MNIMRSGFAACVIALAALATPAAADPIQAFKATITDGTSGNGKGRQTKRDFSLGLDFDVSGEHGIIVSSLGIWDDVYGDGLTSAHTLYLYDLANPTTPLAQINTLPGTGVLIGGYRYFDLPLPVSLAAGTQFSVVVYYPSDNMDSNGNSGPEPLSLNEPTPVFVGDGYGLISNIGDARYGFGSVFPSTLDTGPADRYHAGSFTYSPNPEPGTVVLLSGALAAAGAWRRRRRRAAQQS